MTGLAGGFHRAHRAMHDDLGTVTADLNGRRPGTVDRGQLGGAPGCDFRPGQQTSEHIGLGVMQAQGPGDDVRRHQRPGRGVPTEFIGDQTEVHKAGAADRPAPVGLADQERRPSELGTAAPVVRVEAGAVATEAAYLARRHLFDQEPFRRLSEELLIGAQCEQHRGPETSYSCVVCIRGRDSVRRPASDRADPGGHGVCTGRLSQPRTVEVRARFAWS